MSTTQAEINADFTRQVIEKIRERLAGPTLSEQVAALRALSDHDLQYEGVGHSKEPWYLNRAAVLALVSSKDFANADIRFLLDLVKQTSFDMNAFHERLREFVAEYGPSMGDDQTADLARKLIYGTYNRDGGFA